MDEIKPSHYDTSCHHDRPAPQEQKSNLADLILKLRDEKVALQERIAELEKENDLIAKAFKDANDRFRIRIAELVSVKKHNEILQEANRIAHQRIAELEGVIQYHPGGDCMSYIELAAEYGKLLDVAQPRD